MFKHEMRERERKEKNFITMLFSKWDFCIFFFFLYLVKCNFSFYVKHFTCIQMHFRLPSMWLIGYLFLFRFSFTNFVFYFLFFSHSFPKIELQKETPFHVNTRTLEPIVLISHALFISISSFDFPIFKIYSPVFRILSGCFCTILLTTTTTTMIVQ